MREVVMLHVKINSSLLRRELRWCVDAQLPLGGCHRLCGKNGVGKTTFLEELKLHWPKLFPTTLLGFCDQLALTPFQELTVMQVADILWDATPLRHEAKHWRELTWWQDQVVQSWLTRKVAQLSGGENQWLKILLMRSIKSDVWLLDEPFQSLDQLRQDELWGLLENQPRTIIIVHHGPIQMSSPITNWELLVKSDGLSLEKAP